MGTKSHCKPRDFRQREIGAHIANTEYLRVASLCEALMFLHDSGFDLVVATTIKY